MMIPYVIEKSSSGERSFDLTSRLLEDRIIYMNEQVDSHMAGIIVQSLLYLNSKDSKKPISLYIDSPGGSCTAGLSIISTIKTIGAPVYAYVVGMAASMGAAILSVADKRFAYPTAEIMLHQASSGAEGNVQDMRVSLKQTEHINDVLASIISENVGMSKEDYFNRTQRDLYLTAAEALEFGDYGIVDEVIEFNAEKSIDKIRTAKAGKTKKTTKGRKSGRTKKGE